MWRALATSMACCSSFLTAADIPARGYCQIVSIGGVFPVSSSPLPSQPASRCGIAHIPSPRREHVPYLFSLAHYKIQQRSCFRSASWTLARRSPWRSCTYVPAYAHWVLFHGTGHVETGTDSDSERGEWRGQNGPHVPDMHGRTHGSR
jgi:hypothetical protein